MKELSDSDINQIIGGLTIQEVHIILSGLVRAVDQGDVYISERYSGFLHNTIKEYKDDY